MRGIVALLILTLPGMLRAQEGRGLTPKASVREYEKFVESAQLSLGVNYMGRSFEAEVDGPFASTKKVLLDAGKYLVLELALFPAQGSEGQVSIGDFQLLVDGKKIPLLAATPGMVSAYLKYPDWDQSRRRVVAMGGMGDGTVMVGQPRPVGRFPGDPRPSQQQVPMPNRVSEESLDASQGAKQSALPEGPFRSPRSGNLYFEVPGKLSKIKSLVLRYENQRNRLELQLR